MLEMAEQRFDLWVDRCKGYSLANLRDDMASKIIWGVSQQIAVWGLDNALVVDGRWKLTKTLNI